MNKSSQEEMRKSGDYKISTGEGKYKKMHTVRGEGGGNLKPWVGYNKG